MPVKRNLHFLIAVSVVVALSLVPNVAIAQGSGGRAEVVDCGNGVQAVNMVPPTDFSPLAASDDQLRAWDLPPRPISGLDLKAWTAFITKPIRRISSCGLLTNGYPGSGVKGSTGVSPRVAAPDVAVSSPNWAGNTANGNTYTDAETTFILPAAQVGPSGTNTYSSSWPGVGLGNSRGYPLAQAGSESDNLGPGRSNYYLWWEVFPLQLYQQRIGVTVNPGETLYMHATLHTNVATVHIVDYDLGVDLHYDFSGTFKDDGHAEWIYERTGQNGGLPPLANAPPVFTGVQAATQGKFQSLGSLPHFNYIMADCYGSTLAYPGNISNDGLSFREIFQTYGPGGNC